MRATFLRLLKISSRGLPETETKSLAPSRCKTALNRVRESPHATYHSPQPVGWAAKPSALVDRRRTCWASLRSAQPTLACLPRLAVFMCLCFRTYKLRVVSDARQHAQIHSYQNSRRHLFLHRQHGGAGGKSSAGRAHRYLARGLSCDAK